MKLFVVVEAADGYGVVFAIPELDPDFTDRLVVIADRCEATRLRRRKDRFVSSCREKSGTLVGYG
jgi:hypothetical protein